MLKNLHARKGLQLGVGFVIGIFFGLFLQKGGVTDYNVIIGQLLLKDFTVVKIMMTAMLTGMVGVYFLKGIGLAELHPKPGSVGASVIGGLLFGVGFGILGYCPGTGAGAFGQGNMDAFVGGVIGIMIGAWIFAGLYPRLEKTILHKGDFGDVTIPKLLKVNHWVIIAPVAVIILCLLYWIENAGL